MELQHEEQPKNVQNFIGTADDPIVFAKEFQVHEMTRQISNDGGKGAVHENKKGSNRFLLERGDTLDQHLQQVQHKMEAESIQYQKVGHRIGRTDQRVAAAAGHLEDQLTREE